MHVFNAEPPDGAGIEIALRIQVFRTLDLVEVKQSDESGRARAARCKCDSLVCGLRCEHTRPHIRVITDVGSDSVGRA